MASTKQRNVFLSNPIKSFRIFIRTKLKFCHFIVLTKVQMFTNPDARKSQMAEWVERLFPNLRVVGLTPA